MILSDATCPLFVVANATAFFKQEPSDWSRPDWDSALIHRVFLAYNPHTRLPYLPQVLIGAPGIGYDELFTESFKTAWTEFVRQRHATGFSQFNVGLRRVSPADSEMYQPEPFRNGFPLLEFRFLCSEFFQAPSPWRTILDDPAYGFDLSGFPDCDKCHDEASCDLNAHLASRYPRAGHGCPVSSIHSQERTDPETFLTSYYPVRPVGI